MDVQLEAKLIECLDALSQGESVERILSRYPQDAAQLRPPLETAAGLPALRLEPSEAAKMQSRRKFMAQADLLRRTAPRKTPGFLPRLATGFIAATLVALVLSAGAVAASGSALPGDPLYGLKRTVENVQLSLNGSATARESLSDQFAQRRRDEVNQLLSAGRPGEVEFRGLIEALQSKAWIVSSVVVQLNAGTQIVGTPQINRVAEVRGMTGPNGLRANFISIESSGDAEMTPTPEATKPPQATATLKPTETAAPKTTTTPPTAIMQQPTDAPATSAPQPTATLRPRATAEPTATPEPVEVEFSGSVNSIDQGTWIIDGTTIIIDNGTDVRGTINPGQRVKVKALRLADGGLVATLIELSESGDPGNNGNSNDNHNSNDNQNSHNDNSNDGNSNHNDNGGNTNANDDHAENTNGNDH